MSEENAVFERGELMAQVKSWIDEAAERTSQQTKAELKLELREHQIESEEKTRIIIRQELKSVLGDTPPHEHAMHHAEFAEFRKTRSGIIRKVVTQAVFGLILLGLLFSAGFVQLNNSAILTSNQKEPEKTSQQNSRVKE